MIHSAKLEEVILSQRERFEARDVGVPRRIALERFMVHDRVVVISGVRRCGKSTLMGQIARRCDSFHFMDFDDERLIDFTTEDFAELMVLFTKHSSSKTLFLDEVQNVAGWERFVRRIHDEGYKVYLTGSNAHLLSGELATHLTGRYAKIELFPFSFAELLDFKGLETDRISASVRAQLMGLFDEYLEWGGFPEYYKYADEEFLKRTFDDVVYRDIVQRFSVRDVKAFRQLAHFIFSNTTKELSYNSMASMLGFKNAMTVRNYCGYLEESYLIFEVFRYDYSVKRQNLSNKKLFVIDNGMRNMVAFSFSRDLGRKLENLVFLELKRRGATVFFHREGQECDFLIEDRGAIVDAIQVCYDLDVHNRERERRGLLEAMRKHSLTQGTIITCGQEETDTVEEGVIRVVPAFRWLLE
jgi:uncharacterized protein